MLRLNKKVKDTLKVGCKVTTDFHNGQEKVIRTLTDFQPHPKYGSGYYASADAGENLLCPHCGQKIADPIPQPIDAAWFIPVE